MGLNGIDISSWPDDLVVARMTGCDFVIVKATGGKGYSNECYKRHAGQTLAAEKLLGCYHYARDRGYEGSAEQEADHFIEAFTPYVGKAIPFLDWEADALSLGPSWAKKRLGCAREDRRRARHLHEQVSVVLLRLVSRGRGLPALGGAVPQLRGFER